MASCRKRNFLQRLLQLPFISDNKQLPPLPPLRQLNDSVHEFYSPQDGTSLSVEVIFLHGLEPGDYREAYVETWTSFLDSKVICWPQTLLAEDFRRARILSVSYDSSVEKGPEQGLMDLYRTGENLVHDLIGAGVAANLDIPVVLVGKDLGGLVIKQICMEAKAQNRLTFLKNLKGIFFYGTPHHGIVDLPARFNGDLAKTLQYGNEAIARLNSSFSKDRKNKWVTRAIMFKRSEKVPELVMSEASQRHDGDGFITSRESSIDRVCEYQAQNSSNFQFLKSFISSIEQGELLSTSSPDQGQTGFKTSLGFGDDGNYVPMQTTLAELSNALQNARIVVLHGDPGSGKSSLARYLALQFEAAAQQGTSVGVTSSAEQSSWLPNGVVYMTCGNGAEVVSMQRELLRKFDINLSDKSIALKGVELQKVLHQELVDHLSKLQFRVVVVLDDVWDYHLLENLLVPGDWVRYLVTTQFLKLWNADDSKSVKMQDLTVEDARHILGNYAKFENGVIWKDLENLADEIIVATGLHPLALATLGVVLAEKQSTNKQSTVKGWQKLRDNLKEYLNTGDYGPCSFGRKYPLSVNTSMMLMFNLLDEDAKKLLYKISLFDGPYIPEILLRLFLMYTLPRHEKINITTLEMSLEAKGLVQITSGMWGKSFTNNREDFDMEFIWIHSLRQHFILTTKTEEICQTTDFLDDYNDPECLHLEEVFNRDVATALCAVYGAADIKKRAVQRMGSHFVWSEKYSDGLAAAFMPFVSLMLSEGDTNIEEHRISQAAAEVFLKYVRERKLDGDRISYLLKLTDYPSAPLATLAAFADIFSIEEVNWFDKGHLSFVNVTLSHVDSRDDLYRRIQEKCPAEATLIREYANRVLYNISLNTTQAKSLVMNFPNVLTVLVGEIQPALAEPTQQSSIYASYAAATLGNLAIGDSNETRWKICNAEGVLSGLIQSLSLHSNHMLQHAAAESLANLAGGDVEIKLKICNAEGALSALVQSLSAHDNQPLQESAGWALANLAGGDVEIKSKIGNAEGVLSGLVESLCAHDNHPLQESAARALANLAGGDVEIKLKICNAEGALSALVRSLSVHHNQPLQESAAWALANLATGDVEIKSKICNTEGVLSGLVQSLFAHDNHPLQKWAAQALANLAYGDLEIKSKICNAEGPLSALAQSLSAHDNQPLQGLAAWAFANLASGDVEIKSIICNAEGVLSGLVQSLSAHDNHPLQELGAQALANLADGDVEIKSKICNTEGALSALVQSLSAHENHPLQEAVAQALAYLASGDVEIKSKLCNAEGVLSGLVQSLSVHNNHPLQKAAALALGILANDVEIKSQIGNAEGVLSGLVQSLSAHDNHPLQESGAQALANLADGDVEIKSKICNTEGALSALVQSLSAHENHPLQEAVAQALAYLASGDVEITSKLCNAEGVLSGLVQSLSVHNNHPLQKAAAQALGILANGDMEIKSQICNVEGALSALVESLSAHDNHPLQESVAGALANLADGDVEIKSKICNTEGALSALVQSLSAHDNHPLQEPVAGALANLASGDVEIKSKICNVEGAFSALVQSLCAHDNHPLQELAARALANLADGDVEIKSKICNADGVFSALVQSMSAHDNHPLQELAAGAMTNLANGDVEIKSKICNAEGALSALVQCVCAHDNHLLQELGARALANLANGDVEIKSKICNAEGALSALVQSLSVHDNQSLQLFAAWALANLAYADVEIKSKICIAEGALSALVQSLSAHDNQTLNEMAAWALANLATGDVEIKLKICDEEGAVSGLVKLMLEQDNGHAQENAELAVMNLASTGETARKVGNEKGVVEGLLRAMSQDDKCVLQERAIKALHILARALGESIKLKIAKEEGAIASLVICSEHENPRLRESASGLLDMLFRFTCDSCETRILGTRFNSTMKHDYDLCSECFEKAPDQADYTEIN